MKLYAYFRSSTSYRVRIALGLKGLAAEIIPVNLLKSEQKGEAYRAVNPEMRVPTLIDGDKKLTQSVAIMEYLDEVYPSPALLPVTPAERARVRAIALAIACDISPVANLGQLQYLVNHLGADETQKIAWIRHWISTGFAAVEAMLQSDETGSYCHGSTPTMADCCLIPQVYNAERFGVDMSAYPTIARIAATCATHPAFIAAHPSNQPDAA